MITGQIVGYARVSSETQSHECQVEKLECFGCTKIFHEKVSGATTERAQLAAALGYVREGDSLVVVKLDRLARSSVDLGNIAAQLSDKNVNLVVLDQAIDTSTPTGKLMFNMIAAFAEFERDLIRERCREGIDKAKAKGIRFGRKPKLSEVQITSMRAEFEAGVLSKNELSRKYGISKPSLYRLVNN